MQEQAILQDAIKEQEKALKNHLNQLNRRQMEEYQDKLKHAKMQDQAKGQEMAQQALAEDQRRREMEKMKKNEYSEALRNEVEQRGKMRQLD